MFFFSFSKQQQLDNFLFTATAGQRKGRVLSAVGLGLDLSAGVEQNLTDFGEATSRRENQRCKTFLVSML